MHTYQSKIQKIFYSELNSTCHKIKSIYYKTYLVRSSRQVYYLTMNFYYPIFLNRFQMLIYGRLSRMKCVQSAGYLCLLFMIPQITRSKFMRPGYISHKAHVHTYVTLELFHEFLLYLEND